MKITLKNILIILISLILVILFYIIILFIKKYILINQILTEWKKKTNGDFIKMDNSTNYIYDYYLSFTPYENYNSHIHLLIFKSYKLYNFLELSYVVKKNNMHSKKIIINLNKKPNEICNEMIYNFDNFDKLQTKI